MPAESNSKYFSHNNNKVIHMDIQHQFISFYVSMFTTVQYVHVWTANKLGNSHKKILDR